MKVCIQKDLFLAQQDGPSLPNVAIRLEIRGMGHVPSFKNQKMIVGIKPVPGQKGHWTGNPFIVTKTERKKFMEKVILSFLSQLNSATQTLSAETQTVDSARSLTASLLPHDDSWEWLRSIRVTCQKVSKGEEGATITIVRIK